LVSENKGQPKQVGFTGMENSVDHTADLQKPAAFTPGFTQPASII
jgi:hypothetical protein